MNPKKYRVLLVDDHTLVREGLKAMLERKENLQVVAEAEDGRSAVKLAAELRPDIVIMDVGLPDLNGIEATRQIRDQNPQIKVLALSMHADRHFIVEMLRAGASAYILKHGAFNELDLALNAAMAGQTFLSPKVAAAVVDTFVRRNDEQPKGGAFEVLSAREREVLQLLAEGLTTKLIADRLGTSAKTVDTQRSQIMAKLDIHSIAELTRYAIREGLTPLDR
jgi:DNA-binding NarL/FixJ family response regulator